MFNYFFTTEISALSFHCDLVHLNASFPYFPWVVRNSLFKLRSFASYVFSHVALDSSSVLEVQVPGI